MQLLSDFHYVAPNDKIAKLLVERNVPVFLYVLNTTIEAFDLPLWRRVPHDTEHLLLAGAPFMDDGEFKAFFFIFINDEFLYQIIFISNYSMLFVLFLQNFSLKN